MQIVRLSAYEDGMVMTEDLYIIVSSNPSKWINYSYHVEYNPYDVCTEYGDRECGSNFKRIVFKSLYRIVTLTHLAIVMWLMPRNVNLTNKK